jgi:SAM-dependent methyltransferase
MPSTILKYKVATHKLLTAVKNFTNEVRGVYPYHGNKYNCPVCDANLKYFKGISYDYIKKLEDNAFVYPFFMLETSTIYNFACPHCNATDRDRLYAIYINKKLTESKPAHKLALIDFAPQNGLSVFLKKHPQINYRSADLYMENVDDKVDITDMKIYKNNTFDFFICSHVLEHVKDDKKAISELYRILKPGGSGIAMAPIMLSLNETLEEDNITSEQDRWKYYMQDDHVRLYSKKGFINKLKEGGFVVNQYDINYFGKETFAKHGIQERSVLYIVEAPKNKD